MLDAQHFGVPQRRRRVFVVASAREDFDPSKILFEPSRLSGDSGQIETQGATSARGVGESGPKDYSDERVVGCITASVVANGFTSYTGIYGGMLVVDDDEKVL